MADEREETTEPRGETAATPAEGKPPEQPRPRERPGPVERLSYLEDFLPSD